METLLRKELHIKVHDFLSALYSDDLCQIPQPLVIIGNEGIGKTSIVVEEAATLGSTPINGELDLQRPEADKMVLNEFEKFYLLSMGYCGAEIFNRQMAFIVRFLMQKAVPMYSELKDQKAVIIEIDCMKDEAEAISQALKPMTVYYYKLTKEDWKEWAETIDPITHRANVDRLIIPIALSTTKFEH